MSDFYVLGGEVWKTLCWESCPLDSIVVQPLICHAVSWSCQHLAMHVFKVSSNKFSLGRILKIFGTMLITLEYFNKKKMNVLIENNQLQNYIVNKSSDSLNHIYH